MWGIKGDEKEAWGREGGAIDRSTHTHTALRHAGSAGREGQVFGPSRATSRFDKFGLELLIPESRKNICSFFFTVWRKSCTSYSVDPLTSTCKSNMKTVNHDQYWINGLIMSEWRM